MCDAVSAVLLLCCVLQVCSRAPTTRAACCVTPPCSSCWRCLALAHRAGRDPGRRLLLRQSVAAAAAAATLLQAPGSSSSSSTTSRRRPSSGSRRQLRRSGNSSSSSSTRAGLLHGPWCPLLWARSFLLMTGARVRQPRSANRAVVVVVVVAASGAPVAAARPRPKVALVAGHVAAKLPRQQQAVQQRLRLVGLGVCRCARSMGSP